MSTIDNEINVLFEQFTNFFCIGFGQFLVRHDERATHQRFTELLQQCLTDGVVRYADADCLALGVLQASRNFTGRFENECVGCRRQLFERPEGRVVYPGIGGYV